MRKPEKIERSLEEFLNIKLAVTVIEELVNKGIHSFCICPGGRLAPFVEVLSQSKDLNLFYFFDERSAGFFALGRSERDGNPCAVLSTSGTAVAELLPSVIESHYSAIPLVWITSDRPLSFGVKGSPQTLKKALDIFKDYCPRSLNILKPEDIHSLDWSPSKGSLHLNVCFDEPLIDEKFSRIDFSKKKKNDRSEVSNSKREQIHQATFSKEESFSNQKKNFSFKESHKELGEFFHTCKKPLLLIGELKNYEQPLVQELLDNYKGLFYTEPLSNLEDKPGRLLSGEKILNYAMEKKEIDGLIRLGGIPRVRFWRDLEKSSFPVLNLSSPPFYAGLSRPCLNQPFLDNWLELKSYLSSLKEFGQNLKVFDQEQLEKWKSILKDHPQSEEFWFWTVKKSLRENSQVFLGNSSPVRLWDKVAFCRTKVLHIMGQGGVNGIDGLLSRFLGSCRPQTNNVGILGDLSLLYDMAGFWKSKELSPWTLIVVNNYGGQIFSRMFDNPAFLNSHRLSFSSLAEMWGLNYSCYKNSSDFKWQKDYSLIEICPEKTDTESCFKKYASIWNNL